MFRRFVLPIGALLLTLASMRSAEVVPLDADWRFYPALSEASSPDASEWRQLGFDASGWATTPAPFWYGQPQPSPGTELPDMRYNYSSVFLLRTFPIANLNDVSGLELGAQSDDGFIAWVNGVEVARFNMPLGNIPYDGFSLGALGESDPWPPLDTYNIPNPRDLLVEGENVLAIHAFNASLNDSSDFVINAQLTTQVDEIPPLVERTLPTPNAILSRLTQIEVFFSEPVSGVDAADLLINGTPATDLTPASASQYVFSFPEPPVGMVSVAWDPAHDIQDLATQPHPFGGGSWVYDLDPDFVPTQLVVNEFMASNDRTLHDQFGEDSDWIELHNTGDTALDLDGYYLTDTTNNLVKWRFPQVTIDAGGFLVVFASGRDLKDPTQPLHTNFALDKDAGYLALVNPATLIVSDFYPAYPPQETDVSYGRDQANQNLLGYFLTPTPGGPNAVGGPGFAPDVVLSRPSQAFSGTLSVGLSLAAPTPNTVIRYTLDGSAVTEFSSIYRTPLTLNTTAQVRARAYTDGLLPGPATTAIYTALAADVLNFTTDLPIIILHNNGAGSVPSGSDQPVMMQTFEPIYGVTSMTNAPTLASRAVFHLRGSSTLYYPKGSFFLETQDEVGSGRNVPLLGLPKESDWVLYAPNNFEPVLINNAVAHEISRQMGDYSPRTRFAVVFLNTTGGAVSAANYNGIYVLLEKIKVDDNRVDIARLQPEQTSPPEVTGGYLLSVDRSDPGRPGFSAGGQYSLNHIDPKYEEMATPQRAPQRQYIRDYLDEFYSVLTGPNATDPVNGYAAYIDVPAAINHNIQGVVTFNIDGLRLSGYFRKERNGKIVMGPVWDFDRTQGSTDGRDFNPLTWRSNVPDYGTDMFSAGPTYNNPWYHQLFRDIDFWQRWVDRYQLLRDGALSDANLHRIVDTFANQVRQEQPREVNRWGIRPRSGTQSRDGYAHTFPGTYQGEVDWVKHWYSERLNFIDTNLLDRPFLSLPEGGIAAGTLLTLSGPAGATLYYTLDGTDPRAPGGALAPTARVYQSPIPLNANARVVTRARDLSHRNLTIEGAPPLSTPWSGQTAATYVVTTPSLIIAEIMYHPAPSSILGDTNNADAFEYVELLNPGGSTLNLVGFSFTNGISFTFTPTNAVTQLPPGGRVLVVKNTAAVNARYPEVAPLIAGEYVGSLDNSGEQLSLVGPLLEPIQDFRYNDAWARITDGFGFSLVLRDESALPNNWGLASTWRPSSNLGGSPGTAEPAAPSIPNILINEALTHTDPPQQDSIELYNSDSVPADIGGWWLTDELDQPLKFQIPPNTILNAGDFTVFTESEFTNATASSFRLSSLGDEVYLFSTDGSTNLTGHLHGFSYGAAQNGVSFGRYVTSTGDEHFVAQSVNTLNQPNAAPKVGPLVLNEIMFQPPPFQGTNNNTRDEFIELRNISGQNLPLFDPNATTNTWRIRGGIDFDFPEDLTLPSDGYLLLTSIDPVARPGDVQAFRAAYGLNSQVLILGPYSGQLENQGETVRVLKPDPPQTAASPTPGYVPYVLVDEVDYGIASPWPTNANGSGLSLQRLNSGAYGNDPVNWHTAAATPGLLNSGAVSTDNDGDGLPNDWENAHGLDPNSSVGADGADGDPDGDGLTNGQELAAGTHPNDADTDGDQLPDKWELDHNLLPTDGTADNGAQGDPDGDGATNYDEWISGTDPGNPSDRLRILSVNFSPTEVLLRFRAVAGLTYSIYGRDSINTGTWQKVNDVPAQTATGEIEIPLLDDGTAPFRYYLLATPQQP